MTRFDLSRLHGDDPSYAPGSFRAKRWLYWRAPKSYIEQGYMKDAIRLPGEIGDGRDLERAAKARELTRELLAWASGQDKPKVDPTSLQCLIIRYLNDEFSPYNAVKANTRSDYRSKCGYWSEAAGHMAMQDFNYEVLMRMKVRMESRGASTHEIKAQFTMLRSLISYGVSIELPGAERVRTILSTMKFKTPPPRQMAPTKEAVMAIIAAADQQGQAGLALGIELQWWLSMRMVDVFGQWLEKRWADGLTWDMVDLDNLVITKVASKTRDKQPEAQNLYLTHLPEVADRLKAVPKDQRVGPVVRHTNGQPFTAATLRLAFSRARKAANVSSDVWQRDIRAGAITDGIRHGASLTQAQHAANHRSPSTTNRYIRARDEGANTVIALRRRNE